MSDKCLNLVVVLDESGSMADIQASTMESFNHLVTSQNKAIDFQRSLAVT